MKTKSLTFILVALVAVGLASTAGAEAPTMKYSTEIPANVITPDRTETRLGTLEFTDGFPTAETSEKIWDFMDFSRAVEVMIMTTPAASLQGFRKGIQKWGPDNETMIYWDGRLDSKGLLLTGNTTVVYTFMWIDLKDGPMVMETPPNVLGIIDDAWFHYVCDFGNAGDDKGKGGKYLLVPPDYEGSIPDGYIVKKSRTYGHWLAMRGFMTNFDPDPVVKNMKEHFRLYPLGSAPKEVNWVNTAMQDFNTLHAQDATFFERGQHHRSGRAQLGGGPGDSRAAGLDRHPEGQALRARRPHAEDPGRGGRGGHRRPAHHPLPQPRRERRHLARQQELGDRFCRRQLRVPQRRRQPDQLEGPLPLLRHRDHPGDGQTTGRRGIAVRDRPARLRGQGAGWQQDV